MSLTRQKGIPVRLLDSGVQGTLYSLPWSRAWHAYRASPHLHVNTHRSHSCPCLLVMASGITSASPGPLEMACGKRSRTGRSSALGKTWHPGTPSSRGVCSFWGRNRWVLSHGCCRGGCSTQHPGYPNPRPRCLCPRPCHCILTARPMSK